MYTIKTTYKTDKGEKTHEFTAAVYKDALSKEQDFFKDLDYDLVQRLIEGSDNK